SPVEWAGDRGTRAIRPFIESVREAYTENNNLLGAYDALVKRMGDGQIWRSVAEWQSEYGEAANGAAAATTKLADASGKKKKALTEAEKAALAFAKQRESDLRSQYERVSAL